jgi:hypothetical protein
MLAKKNLMGRTPSKGAVTLLDANMVASVKITMIFMMIVFCTEVSKSCVLKSSSRDTTLLCSSSKGCWIWTKPILKYSRENHFQQPGFDDYKTYTIIRAIFFFFGYILYNVNSYMY